MSTKAPIHVLIVGTGMYVSGRHTSGSGTVLPAVLQARRDGIVGNVSVATHHGASFTDFDQRARAFAEAARLDPTYRRFPREDSPDPLAYREAIQELRDPGAVIVVTPDEHHHDVAMAAIAARKHVLVVKPLCPSVDQAMALVDAAERVGVYAAVEFHKRWDWANLKLKEALASGRVGRPLHFLVEYSQRRTVPLSWFRSWAERTNIFQYLGVHYADLIYFLTGAHPERVLAIGQHGLLREHGVDALDTIQAVVEWSSGFSSTFLTGWIDPVRSAAVSQQAIKVVGTTGRIESDQTCRGFRVVTDQGVEEVNPYFSQPYIIGTGATEIRGYGIDSIRQFIEDASAVAAGEITAGDLEFSRPTFRQAVPSTAIVEAVAVSLSRGGAWVTFGKQLRPRP